MTSVQGPDTPHYLALHRVEDIIEHLPRIADDQAFEKRELCELLNTDRAFRDIYGTLFFGDNMRENGAWPVASPQTLPRCSPVQLRAFVAYITRNALEAKSRHNSN